MRDTPSDLFSLTPTFNANDPFILFAPRRWFSWKYAIAKHFLLPFRDFTTNKPSILVLGICLLRHRHGFLFPLVWRDDLEWDGAFVGGFADVDRVSLLVVGEVLVAEDDPLPEEWTRKRKDLAHLRYSSLRGIGMIEC